MESSFTISLDSHVFPPEVSDSIPREFVRCASYSIPRTLASEVSQKLPTFLAFRPIPPLPPDSQVPVIDCRRGDYPKCSTCQAFLSPFCVVNAKVRSWRCAICGHLNSTIHFTSMFDMRVNITDRQELHHLVYDCLPPKNMLALRGKARVFMFVVDERLLQGQSLDVMLSHIDGVNGVCRSTDEVALITFGSAVTLVNLQTRRGRSFVEFDPSLLKKDKDDIFVSADVGVPAIKRCLSALGRSCNGPACLYQAMQWAVDRMNKRGGRLLLFTSGSAPDSRWDILSKIWQTPVSVNVFRLESIVDVERVAECTGGIVSPFNNLPSLLSLFSTETAWDASSCLRVPPSVKVVSVMGSLSQKDQMELYPIVMSTQSVIYELRSESLGMGDCCFQMAFRYLDDNGIRKVRVINGRLPYTDVIKLPIDEAALTLFLARKRCFEQAAMYTSRVILTRPLRADPDSQLPVLLYTGWTADTTFVLSCSVERFALSVFVTRVVLFGKTFQVLFSPTVTTVYPKATEDEEEALRVATTHLGLCLNNFWYPEPETEFQSMVPSHADAENWYNSLCGYAP